MSQQSSKTRVKPEKQLPGATVERITDYIENSVPEKHKIATKRVLFGQVPRSTAIRIKCLQCCNYDREEVKACPVVTCALNSVRPYQSKTKATGDGQ